MFRGVGSAPAAAPAPSYLASGDWLGNQPAELAIAAEMDAKLAAVREAEQALDEEATRDCRSILLEAQYEYSAGLVRGVERLLAENEARTKTIRTLLAANRAQLQIQATLRDLERTQRRSLGLPEVAEPPQLQEN